VAEGAVREDRPDDRGIVERGDQAQPAPTMATGQHVDAERPVHQAAQFQARGLLFTPAPSGPVASRAAAAVRSGMRRP
jgi:hypothetical protein